MKMHYSKELRNEMHNRKPRKRKKLNIDKNGLVIFFINFFGILLLLFVGFTM